MSRKRSATRRRAPEPVVYFLDYCLGRQVGQRLQAAGLTVEFHADHFPQDAPDVDWIPEVGRRTWVVLTKDKNIRHRGHERDAVLRANVRMFVLSSGKLTGDGMAERFITHRARMERLIRNHRPPFIAVVYEHRVGMLYPEPEEPG